MYEKFDYFLLITISGQVAKMLRKNYQRSARKFSCCDENICGYNLIIVPICMLLILIFGVLYGSDNNPSEKYHVDARIVNVKTANYVGGTNVVYSVVDGTGATCEIKTQVNAGMSIYKINDTISITPIDDNSGRCAIYVSAGNQAEKYLTVIIVSVSVIGFGILLGLIRICIGNCSEKYWMIRCKNCCKCYVVCCDDIDNIVKNDVTVDNKQNTEMYLPAV